MVNGISGYNGNSSAFYRAAAGTAVAHKNDVENMIRFVNGQPLNTVTEPGIAESAMGILPFAGIFGAFQGIGALKNNGFTGSELEKFKADKKAGTAKGWNIKETIKNVNARYPYAKGDAIKAGKDFLNREYGDFFKKTTTPNETRIPLISKFLDKIPGYTKLRATGFGKAMGRSGAGFMAVMDGAIKTMTDVVPAFQQLGFKAGMKQLAKTGTEVAVGAAGWLAGDAIGMAAGAAIGTAIFPGVGTAIGGFLGRFLGGAIGGAVAAKTAKAITGKTEIEKASDAQISQAAQQVNSDEETKIALAQAALEQANQILAQYPQSPDALAAKEAAEAVLLQAAQNVQTAQTTQVQQPALQQPQTGFNPAFQGIPEVPGFNGYGYDMNVYNQAMANASMPYVSCQTYSNPFMSKLG